MAEDDNDADSGFKVKIMEIRRKEFMDICEVELTPLPSGNG